MGSIGQEAGEYDAELPAQRHDESAPGCPPMSNPVGEPEDSAISRQRPSFVYALGQIQCRFPSLSIEKEFAQATGRADTVGKTDREVLQSLLMERSNRYLVRQLCWVMAIEGLETYVLVPRDPGDLDVLVDAIRPRPRRSDLDVVVGVRGPIAEPHLCNGLPVPMVALSQVYSFDREDLIAAIPCPSDLPEEDEDRFRTTAEELLDHVIQLADNAGATDEHRALNYLVVRYPAIYARTARAHSADETLSGVAVQRSALSGIREMVDVIFAYTNRRTDVTSKFAVRVDVTEEFPFLVRKLAPYYDR